MVTMTTRQTEAAAAEPEPGGDHPQLINLDRRSREIFRQIVDTYLKTGEPVGSRNLSRLLPMSLSPASVRNVMADLEELGLIRAPHVSAGRMPTEAGLRFFVDAMLEVGDLSPEEQRAIESRIGDGPDARPVQDLLAEASETLSGVSQGAGVVLATKADMRLKHMEFIRLEPTRALVVLVGEDGSVVAIPDGRVDDSVARPEQRGPVALRKVGVRVQQRGRRHHWMAVKLALGWRLGCEQ